MRSGVSCWQSNRPFIISLWDRGGMFFLERFCFPERGSIGFLRSPANDEEAVALLGWSEAGRQEECVTTPTEILCSGQFECGTKAAPVQVSFNKTEDSRQDCGHPEDFISIPREHKYKMPSTACYVLAFKPRS